MNNIFIRKIIFNAISLAFSAILILMLLAELKSRDEDNLIKIAKEHISTLELVLKDAAATLDYLNSRGFLSCNEETIVDMSKTLFKASYVKSVGFINNNDELVCTTGLGLLKSPLKESKPDYVTKDNYQVWVNKKLILFNKSYSALIVKKGNFNAVIDIKNLFTLLANNFDWELVFRGNDKSVSVVGINNLHKNFNATQESFFSVNRIVYCAETIEHCVYLSFDESEKSKNSEHLLIFSLLFILFYYCSSLSIINYWQWYSSLNQRVKRGMKSGNIYPVFQPIVELKSGKVVGCEVLSRYKDSIGVISPDKFIPIIKQLGGTWNFTEQLINQTLLGFKKEGLEGLKVNFNVFPQDIDNKGIIDLVNMPSFQKSSNYVCIEVIEDALLVNDESKETLKQLQSNGIEIAIDDFGTGYSNLHQMSQFPCNYLKIDRSFINAIEAGSIKSSLIPHIIGVARTLNVKIVAEGVENLMQHEVLNKLGIEYAQGWVYGKPSSLKNFKQILLSSNVKR